jgi:hypothetical protein
MELSNFFPIYDLLHSQIESTENKDINFTDEEIKDLINKINILDKLGRDMIYIFIRIHSLRFSNSKLLDIPYKGISHVKESDKEDTDMCCDVKFDLKNFPNILNKMLLRFTDLHLRKLQEDSLKNKLII